MISRRGDLCLLLSALLCSFALGCGGPGEKVVAVEGRVTNAGQPLPVAGREMGLGMVRVEFYRIGEDGQQTSDPETAGVDKDGYFRVRGPDGNGIPPGKYRIAVRQWDPFPDTDRLEGKFDENNSPIVREIATRAEIIIDVSKPEG